VYTALTPWFYADSKVYLGDTWWVDNAVVINDLSKLSIIDFLKKYRGVI